MLGTGLHHSGVHNLGLWLLQAFFFISLIFSLHFSFEMWLTICFPPQPGQQPQITHCHKPDAQEHCPPRLYKAKVHHLYPCISMLRLIITPQNNCMNTAELFVLQFQDNSMIGFDSYIIQSSNLEIDSKYLKGTGVFIYPQFLLPMFTHMGPFL